MSAGNAPPALQVLTDPVLWRCITPFQRGLPFLLFDFWVAYEPDVAVTMAASSTDRGRFVRSGMQRLQQLVVTHGTLHLLDLFVDAPYGHNYLGAKNGFGGVVERAITANRADMLAHALPHDPWREEPVQLWRRAFRCCQDGDMRVLQVLQAHTPITVQELEGIVSSAQHVQVVQFLEVHYPGARKMEPIVDSAAHVGNLVLVQYLVEQYPHTQCGPWPFESAYHSGHLEILRYLLQRRPTEIDPEFLKRLLRDGDAPLLALLHSAGGWEVHAHDVATACIADEMLDRLVRLSDAGLISKKSEFSIDELASKGRLDIITFLTDRATTTATTEAMDRASDGRHWDLVEYLHEHRTEGCTTAAMDAAAQNLHLPSVVFFHEKRTEGCTTAAMDAAAKCGALTIVQFLHEHRTEGCTPAAMDHAAGNGHLAMVQFLHEHRAEGCTTDAMDLAAENGHLHVVQFLHAYRSEGCTVTAIQKATNSEYLDVVRFLYRQYRALFSPDLLHDLLLHGAFEIWMELRDQYPDQAHAVVEQVLVEAGKRMKLATIQFVVDQLGRRDLAYLAMNGAAQTAYDRDSQWLQAVYAIAGPGSCRLSAIERTMESSRPYGRLERLQFLINVCSESGAYELALQLEQEDRHLTHNAFAFRAFGSTADRSEAWQLMDPHGTGDDSHSNPSLVELNPLLLDVRTPSWAIANLFEIGHVWDPYSRLCRPQISWAVQAIIRGDHRLLAVVRDLQSSGELLSPSSESGFGMFSFDGARAAAARKGDLQALQWLFENARELPVEPTLLNVALFYHQFDIAEYLVAHYYPDACCEFDWDSMPYLRYLGPCGLDMELLDWIQNNTIVQNAVDFGDLASHAVAIGELTGLQRLYELCPDIVLKRLDDLLTHAAGHPKVISFLTEIQ